MSGRVGGNLSSSSNTSTSTSSQKIGPMKATLPMASVLRGTSIYHHYHHPVYGNCTNFLPVLSPPIRHISPEHSICGHRSPGSSCFKGSSNTSGNGGSGGSGIMRRTASLDALYVPPSWSLGMVSTTVLHLDKSTQTDESIFDRTKSDLIIPASNISSPEIKIEKVIRQRWQRTQKSSGSGGCSGSEHSVSSQTLSPIHYGGKASPVLIPQRTNSQIHMRPMRSSVEGLNQEIEKLILYTSQTHSCRNESGGLFSRATPEGHRAPLAELFHNEMRSVNTQTPIGDMLSSDESHSTSPEDGATSLRNASPRINRFLAREPPDGCEKVCLKQSEADQGTTKLFKPSVGFQLRPSICSAFQPLQPILSTNESKNDSDEQKEE